MTFLATMVLFGKDWLWPAALFVAVTLAVLLWSYRATHLGAYRWLCLLLKLLGLCALAFCLLEPYLSSERAKPGANLFLVVADNSQGLQIKDRGEDRTRGDNLRALLDPNQNPWPAKLAEQFELRRYSFDARLQSLKDFNELTFDGPATALATSVRTLSERFKGRPVAGVLLFTDGNATDLGATPPDWSGLPPIFPIVIGRDDPIPDIAIENTHVTQTAFEDAPVTIQAEVRVAGFKGEPIVARLVDRKGAKVLEQTLPGPPDDEALAFHFQFRPLETGITFYQLRVGLSEDARAASRVPEATLANNQRVLVVDRGRGPYRILYVSGRPNWEFKFLNRAVAEDDQIQLVALIRVAKREPKFDFRGRAGETSNPLFRGFNEQSREETERYDQPVLVRLNTRDELELHSGFPLTPEELYPYHAVIFDDIESEYFNADQALLTQKFVSERGGGFLMLGGMESFQAGNYLHNPVGDMLPVYLDRAEELKAPPKMRLSLTREGLLQSWARLRDQEADEKTRLDNMPAFQVLNPVREIKPAASVIATVTGETGQAYPALVVQRFGRGRTAALMVGDLWRWGMRDEAARRDLEKSWRQLLRWLVADVPKRVELQAAIQAGDPNQAVQLQVRARDPKFLPLDDAAARVEVQPIFFDAKTSSNSSPAHLMIEPSSEEPGLFTSGYVPRQAGGYLAKVAVTNAAGQEVGQAEAGWSTDPAAAEFRTTKPNRALLEELARKTKGEVVPAERLADFVQNLPRRRAPIMEAWSFPLWHTPAMFAFALACLIAEWGIRRWKGLP